MIGELEGEVERNDSHATQISRTKWARHGGLGPIVNHSCDPNCGVEVNQTGACDFVARESIADGDEITFDYAMRNYSIEHFPGGCLCGADTVPRVRHRLEGPLGRTQSRLRGIGRALPAGDRQGEPARSTRARLSHSHLKGRGAGMELKRLFDKAKKTVDERGGVDSLKQDAEELKDIATSKGSLTDKAKGAAGSDQGPGKAGGRAAGAETALNPGWQSSPTP